jgi:hypothetical protein
VVLSGRINDNRWASFKREGWRKLLWDGEKVVRGNWWFGKSCCWKSCGNVDGESLVGSYERGILIEFLVVLVGVAALRECFNWKNVGL